MSNLLKLYAKRTSTTEDDTGVRETAYLLALRMLGLAFNGAATLYLGFMLPNEAFGRFSFFVGFVTLTYTCSEFGVFLAAGRVAAFAASADLRRLLGALLVLSVPLYLIYLVLFATAAVVANHFDRIYFEAALIPAILLAPGVLIHYGLTEFCTGAGRMRTLGLLRCLPYFLLTLVVVALGACGELTYPRAATAFAASFQTTVVVMLIALRPRFDGLAASWMRLRQQQSFGFNVYLSRLIAVGVYNLDLPLVGFFLDFRQLSQYTLARAIAMPLALVGQTYSATRYQHYARVDSIPVGQQRLTHALAAVSALLPLTLGFGLVRLVFPGRPPEFYAMLQILSGSVFFRFVYPIYNMFLHASGRGAALRNAAVVSGVFNLLCYIILIPTGGLYGVAATDALVCGIYYVHQVWLYRQAVNETRLAGLRQQPAAAEPAENLPLAA